MPGIKLVQLIDHTRIGFRDKEAAYKHHYENGGYLWKTENKRFPYQFVAGLISAPLLDFYALFMVNGRQPTAQDIVDAKEAISKGAS